jgi:F-type H+-transporting ATPase subunit delta
MQDGTIGRRYARALALSLGDDVDVKTLQQIDGELSALAALLEQRTGNTDFRQAMLNPSFGAAGRRTLLDKISDDHGVSDPSRRLLRLLVDKDRIAYLPQIARAFRREVDERSGQVRAHIVSARMLSDSQSKKLVTALEKRTGKKVVPELEVEPEIIGGVQARVGGLVFDNSVKSQLDRMRGALSR